MYLGRVTAEVLGGIVKFVPTMGVANVVNLACLSGVVKFVPLFHVANFTTRDVYFVGQMCE